MKKLYSAVLFAIAAGAAMAQTPIWSDDFSNASTWTMGNINGATGSWVIGTTAPSGDFPIDPIESTTAANGFALYDSDLLCNVDNAYIVNTTPIDLSSHPYVMLQFQEFYRNYQGQTFVDVSNNGTTWTTTQVNGSVASNASTDNPTLVSLPITAVAGGQSTVYIRFRYVGQCDYSWMVDDAVILPQPDNDMAVVNAGTNSWTTANNTYDSLSYTIYPVSEIRPMAVNMAITNSGAQSQTNVTAEISSNDGYDESENVGTIAPTDTVNYFPVAYTPTSTIGSHELTFSVTADATDANPADNSTLLKVGVSNFIYARDAGALDGGYNDTDNGDAFKLGNGFHVIVDETLYGIDAAFPSTSDIGVELNAQLLDPTTANFDPLAETGYHTLVTSDLSPTGGNKFVSFIFDTPVQLTAGTDYVVAVQHFGGANVLVGTSGNSPEQTSYIYSGSQSDWFYVTSTPMVRMNFNISIGIAENDIHDGLGLGQNYPNPANSGSTRIDYSLEQQAQVNMELRDVSGKLVQTLVQGSMAPGTHHVDVNTANLGAGVYFYTLTTNNAVSTKRMTVVR